MRWVILFAASVYGADLLDHPAIRYSSAPVHDPVALLDPSKLKADLRSVLDALHVPVDSHHPAGVVELAATDFLSNLVERGTEAPL